MTLNEAQSIINSITYKPNTKLNIRMLSKDDHIVLTLTSTEIDSNDNSKTILINNQYYFDPYGFKGIDKEYFLTVVKSTLVDAAKHEVDEWFKVNGKHYTDPHPKLKKT